MPERAQIGVENSHPASRPVGAGARTQRVLEEKI
jgi:hypothetical protein